MIRYLACILFLVVAVPGQSQVTTFILIRHAEKLPAAMNDGNDPELTVDGKNRAMRLADHLRETKIDAIYSTNYKRTRNTVAPLAAAKGLTIQGYDARGKDAADAMMKANPGGTILVVGHSNSTPAMANYLLGRSELKDWEDADYDNLLIITVVEKGNAKLVWLNY